MFEIFELKKGAHEDPSKGICVMEAAAWLAGEPHSDSPVCACPSIRNFTIVGNDKMDSVTRQRFKEFIPRIIGSRDPGAERRRAEHFAWAAVTIFAPRALESAGLKSEAAELRNFDKSLGLGAASKAARAASKVRWAAAAVSMTEAKARWAATEAVRWAAAAAVAESAAESAESAESAARWAAVAAQSAAESAESAESAARWAAVAAEAAEAEAAESAARGAAESAAKTGAWDDYFRVFDEALNLGKQGSNDYDYAPRVEAYRQQIYLSV